MNNLWMIFVGTALIHNAVLTRFLGVGSALSVSEKVKPSAVLGGVVALALTLVSALASLLYDFVLTPLNLDYLQTAAFVAWAFRAVVKAGFPGADKTFAPLYPLIAANTAILGVALINVQEGYRFWECVLSGLGAGLGYALVTFLLACVQAQMNEKDVPESLRGTPIVLLAAALMSIAFMGFANL